MRDIKGRHTQSLRDEERKKEMWKREGEKDLYRKREKERQREKGRE